MKMAIITGLVSFLRIISVDAQENISIYPGLQNQSEIKKHTGDPEFAGSEEQSHLMSIVARETPFGSGKGEIVSNQAKQLGESKRHINQTKRTTFTRNGSSYREIHGNRSGMNASICHRTPNNMAVHSFRAAMQKGHVGRR